jgi:holo-[acyl-carrier protein] synthase
MDIGFSRMVRGIGVDLVEVARVREALRRHADRFATRVFTEAEAAYCLARKPPEIHFAARLAAKEAAMKALGTGFGDGVGWRDVEVLPDPRGAPLLVVGGAARDRALALGIDRFHVSLSHTETHAVALVVAEG